MDSISAVSDLDGHYGEILALPSWMPNTLHVMTDWSMVTLAFGLGILLDSGQPFSLIRSSNDSLV